MKPNNCNCCMQVIWNKNKSSKYCERCAYHQKLMLVKLRYKYCSKKIQAIKKSDIANKEEVLEIMKNA